MNKQTLFLTWVFAAVLLFVIYLPSINSGPILDDYDIISKNDIINKYIRGISKNGFLYHENHEKKIITGSYYYRPVTILSYILEKQIYKKSGDSFLQYHRTNIIIHYFSALLIFIILKNIWQKEAGLWVSLLFLFHPVCSQSINWVSARSDLLGTFFVLLTIYFIIKKKLVLSAITAAAAIFSKETYIIIPIIGWFASWQLTKKDRIKIVSAYIILDIVRIYIYIIAIKEHPQINKFIEPGVIYYLWALLESISRQFFIVIAPIKLQFIYNTAIFLYRPVLSIICILSFIIVIIGINRILKNKRVFKMSIGFFIIGIILSALLISASIYYQPYFIQLQNLYFPSIGVIFLIVALLNNRRHRTKILNLILLIFIILTFVRNFEWKNEKTLFIKDYKRDFMPFATVYYLYTLPARTNAKQINPAELDNYINILNNLLPYYHNEWYKQKTKKILNFNKPNYK